MKYTYKTSGTCSTQIDFEVEDNILKKVAFTGGCNGNLQAVSRLVEGLPLDEVIHKLSGISCNGKPTSCGDQLARACQAALTEIQGHAC